MIRSLSAGLVLLSAAALAACATGRAPEELAERTAANVGVVASHLKRLDQDSRNLADLRATNVATLHAANARRRAAYNYDVALTKQSGGQAELDLIPQIKQSGGQAELDLIPQIEAWGKEVDAIFKAADNAEQERKAAVLGTQTSIDTKSETLAQVAEALAALARDESIADRARFLSAYAGQLRKEIDDRLAQSDKSATEAKLLLDDVKDRLTKTPE
jgi:hypothetical protein